MTATVKEAREAARARLATVLAEQFPTLEGMERPPSLDSLVHLPPTPELRAQVVKAQDAMGAAPYIEVRQQQNLLRAHQQLRWGQVRDVLQADRPADCWCLGDGSINRYDHSFPGTRFDRPPLWCPCPDGQAALAAHQAAERERMQQERTKAQRRHWEAAGVPSRFQKFTFESFPVTAASQASVEAARQWWDGPDDEGEEDDSARDRWWEKRRQSLLLWGSYGVGKTGVAVAILKHYIRDEAEPAFFVTVPALLARIRATYGHDAEEDEDDVLGRVMNSPFLVLDDLGAEKITDWVLDRLFLIINHRHDEDLPTVFTSNLSPQELGDHIGERLMWRVIEMADIVHLEGPNLRDRKAREGTDVLEAARQVVEGAA